jgi:hypothetical protein
MWVITIIHLRHSLTELSLAKTNLSQNLKKRELNFDLFLYLSKSMYLRNSYFSQWFL